MLVYTPQICSDKVRFSGRTRYLVLLLYSGLFGQNKPNGQFRLPHESKAIIEFMHDLSIRKIPGVGRVNERLLDSIGIKVRVVLFKPVLYVSLAE